MWTIFRKIQIKFEKCKKKQELPESKLKSRKRRKEKKERDFKQQFCKEQKSTEE